jgi:hypothetical protein
VDHPAGRCWGGGGVVFIRSIFILNETLAQEKIYVVGRQFAWLKYFITQYRHWLRTIYKQHVLFKKVCYSLAELNVKSVYFNLFG